MSESDATSDAQSTEHEEPADEGSDDASSKTEGAQKSALRGSDALDDGMSTEESEGETGEDEESSDEERLPERLIHYRWDLDKTYIYTEFDSLGDLFRTWLQKPEDKRNVPGASTLLREMLEPRDEIPRKITFISGSPRQMRKVLEKKLKLDGIEPDQFILKPNLSNLLLFRFKSIRSQVGYKLEALLRSRLFGEKVDEILFGDDSEQDALVYSLYADLIRGEVSKSQLEWVLFAADTAGRESGRILDLIDHLVPSETAVVHRIFIHLERRSPTSRFDVFGARVVPVFNYFQAALVLQRDRMLPLESLIRVIESMGSVGYTPFRLTNSLQDLIRRGYLVSSDVAELISALSESPESGRTTESFREALADVDPKERAPAPILDRIDYAKAARDLKKYRRNRPTISGIRLLD